MKVSIGSKELEIGNHCNGTSSAPQRHQNISGLLDEWSTNTEPNDDSCPCFNGAENTEKIAEYRFDSRGHRYEHTSRVKCALLKAVRKGVAKRIKVLAPIASDECPLKEVAEKLSEK